MRNRGISPPKRYRVFFSRYEEKEARKPIWSLGSPEVSDYLYEAGLESLRRDRELSHEIAEFIFNETREAGYHSISEETRSAWWLKQSEQSIKGIISEPDPKELLAVVRNLHISNVKNIASLNSILCKCEKESRLLDAISISEAFGQPTEHLYILMMRDCEQSGQFDDADKIAAKINERQKLATYIKIGEILQDPIVNEKGEWLNPEKLWKYSLWL